MIIERKVHAGAAGAGAGAAIAGAIVWALDWWWWTPGMSGDLPPEVTALVVAVTAAASSWVAGYIARHTPRPDLQ